MDQLDNVFIWIATHPPKTGSALVIAMDGPAAAGKSTLAKQLGDFLHVPVIHMDDFFLPPDLRTPERFAIPGGNVHLERFREEVLPYVKTRDAFTYRKFDCQRMDYTEDVQIEAGSIRIVEGAYSHHPDLGDYADLKVFVTIPASVQKARIVARNSAEQAQRFREQWIPLENAYFDAYSIADKAELTVKNI